MLEAESQSPCCCYPNTTGNYNTANGSVALSRNTTGNFNTAIGTNALNNNAIGSNNTAVGVNALKEHRTVEDQKATIRQQRKDFEAAIAQRQKQIEALTRNGETAGDSRIRSDLT